MIHISLWPCDKCGPFPGGFWHYLYSWSHDAFCLGDWKKNNNDPIPRRAAASLWQRFQAQSSEMESSGVVRSSRVLGHQHLPPQQSNQITFESVPSQLFWLRVGLLPEVISEQILAKQGCVDGNAYLEMQTGNLPAIIRKAVTSFALCAVLSIMLLGRGNYQGPFLK